MRTRFAPSPTGLLHLGHAYSALLASDMARAAGGQYLLRIEDTDRARCRPQFETAIYEDLRWLQISWSPPVWHQAQRLAEYERALGHLSEAGFCYPCACSRSDIRAALAAPQEGPAGPPTAPNPPYPGTCRHRSMSDCRASDAIRLNIDRVLHALPAISDLSFTETGPGHTGRHFLSPEMARQQVGDIVLARRDAAAAYHLAVVTDDAAQQITDVIRGADLFEATFIHRLLQALLGLPTPTYHHHKLIRDQHGKRLAKRDDARAIRKYRHDGASPQDLRHLLAL